MNKSLKKKLEKKRGDGIKWSEECEKKSLNFILNLEKSKPKNNAITRLVQRDGAIVTIDSAVIKEIRNYYEYYESMNYTR